MPKGHTKPTKEELDADIKKSLEEAEALKDQPEPKLDEPAPEPEPVVEPGLVVEPAPEPEPVVEPEPEIDYKKRFVESTKEGQILHSKTKKMAEAIDKAGEIPESTDEEMIKEYPDWEIMDEATKKIAKSNTRNERRFAIIAEAHKESKDIEVWHEKVDAFISDPRTLIDNSELEGRETDFRVFATKPTRRGADLKDIVSSFLWELGRSVKPASKGQMFPTGSGGPNDRPKPKSDKLSIDEARVLRKNDYPKYVELLKAGKIDLTTI